MLKLQFIIIVATWISLDFSAWGGSRDNEYTVKFLNVGISKQFAVITLKFKQSGSTIE